MLKCHNNGIEVFFVDESHWEIGRRTICCRLQKGRKHRQLFFFFHTTRFTVISAMSSLGNLYAETVKNMVTASVFEIFIKNLFKWYHKEIKPERGVI